jgi:hypothetical protein
MKRVTGIGGIFFKGKDPKALQAWYQQHLGIDVQPWGGAAFSWSAIALTIVAWVVADSYRGTPWLERVLHERGDSHGSSR